MDSTLAVGVKSDHVGRPCSPLVRLTELNVLELLSSGWSIDVPRLDCRDLWIAFIVWIEAGVLLLMNLVD